MEFGFLGHILALVWDGKSEMVFEMNRTLIAFFFFLVFKTGKFGDEFVAVMHFNNFVVGST